MNVYEAIFTRRDVRRFRPDPVPDAVLRRILEAAHHAPSVGFMQPWSFLVIRDRAVRRRIEASFQRERLREAENYTGARRAQYLGLVLQGILESPVNVCVTCDRERAAPVLGRNTVVDADLFSTCLAVQNLWLAARAEGVGVGWVSILDPAEVARALQIPEGVVPVAYLCLGYPESFPERPELESAGWRRRLPLDELVFRDAWGRRGSEGGEGP